MRLINKKLPADMRTSIYERLMEPDIDVEVKNLAIQLTALTKLIMEEAVKTFKENKELEKAEAIRLKTETRVSLRAVGVVICIKCGHSWKGRIKKIAGGLKRPKEHGIKMPRSIVKEKSIFLNVDQKSKRSKDRKGSQEKDRKDNK